MRRAGFSKKFLKQYQDALRQHSAGRSTATGIVGNSAKDSALSTFAQLQAEARAGVLKLKEAHTSLQTELQEMRETIPLLVRSIWGAHAGAILSTMRQRKANVSRLITQWQDAEHRLIAVANSLTHLQTGQKLIAVGAPLAAAHLLGSTPSSAQCYQALPTRNTSSHTLAEGSLTLGQLNALVSHLAEEITLLQRGVFLFFLFLPMLVTAPVLLLTDKHRDNWMKLMIWTIDRAGPAFIKWGQWAATRPDLFAPDVCSALAELQTNAPSHTFTHTKQTVENAFKRPIEQIFATFDEKPVASGSIAQVHRAILTPLGAQLAQNTDDSSAKLLGGLIPLPRRASRRREALTFADGAAVAVKVRHPGVTELMEQDFILMNRAASILGALPGGAGPQLKESLMQFGAPMREQMDLRSEAQHLSRFAENFKWWSGVRFPLPAAPSLVASDVLVESFEEGEHISKYLNTEYAHNKRLAYLGMSCYLKMLLRDNFIHADLHPGNILVSLESPSSASAVARRRKKILGGLSDDDVESSCSSTSSPSSGIVSRIGSALGWNFDFDFRVPRLVLLDVGMTARLSGEDQRNLVGFFSSLAAMDGGGLADSILKFSEKDAANPMGFKIEMKELFDALEPDYMRENSQQVIGWIMDTIRKHQVHLKGVVTTVVFSSMVLEGWSTKLNPDIRIVETLKGILPSEWRTRAEAAVDKVVENQMMITMA